jgi:hypothetical protein
LYIIFKKQNIKSYDIKKIKKLQNIDKKFIILLYF